MPTLPSRSDYGIGSDHGHQSRPGTVIHSPLRPHGDTRDESPLPATTFTLELFLGACLGCCTSAVWTLHRANVSHNFLENFLRRFRFSLLTGNALLFVCLETANARQRTSAHSWPVWPRYRFPASEENIHQEKSGPNEPSVP